MTTIDRKKFEDFIAALKSANFLKANLKLEEKELVSIAPTTLTIDETSTIFASPNVAISKKSLVCVVAFIENAIKVSHCAKDILGGAYPKEYSEKDIWTVINSIPPVKDLENAFSRKAEGVPGFVQSKYEELATQELLHQIGIIGKIHEVAAKRFK